MAGSVAVASEDLEEEQEEVDKVEVEGQCADGGELGNGFGGVVGKDTKVGQTTFVSRSTRLPFKMKRQTYL